jgi:hypothetical protein
MANTYTWKITNMTVQKELDNFTDVVIETEWSCTGTDGTHYASSLPGTTRIMFEGGVDFTPYNDLTQEQVLNWIWARGVDQNAVQSDIDNQINLQVNPPSVILPLPWNN